jgi:N-acetylglucosaminyldiphosphoundecaprenol N-acetyl-beta-D-mannosaminyltransferase
MPVDAVDQQGALNAIADLIDRGQGGYVVTPNVDHIVLAARDVTLRRIYQDAALSLADGQPLTWMARMLGTPLPARVSGSDLFMPLMRLAAEREWRVFFFGASEEVSREAARRLTKNVPGLQIVGRDSSMWSPNATEPAGGSPVVRAIQETEAQLVVLALGCPRQEQWMARHRHGLGPAVAIGLGASLDFAAGQVRRAPAWMSRTGLEWLFRLWCEPRRLAHRYLVRDPQIVPIFLRALARADR